MSDIEILGPDGRPADSDVVTPFEYLDDAGGRAGFTATQRKFFRQNASDKSTDPATADPRNLTRSQRQIYALRAMLEKAALDNLQLWTLLAAATERAGGAMSFKQTAASRFIAPKTWPTVIADGDDVRIALPGHEDTLTPEAPSE